MKTATRIVAATMLDVPQILQFIQELAEYERLQHQMVANEDMLRQALFGPRPAAEVVFLEADGEKVGFALFFHNFSTFLGRSGLYLEDLYVRPQHRGRGYGKQLLIHLANLAVERNCGRMEWSVLDWNKPALDFYKSLGAQPLNDWIVHRVSREALESLAKQLYFQGARTLEQCF